EVHGSARAERAALAILAAKPLAAGGWDGGEARGGGRHALVIPPRPIPVTRRARVAIIRSCRGARTRSSTPSTTCRRSGPRSPAAAWRWPSPPEAARAPGSFANDRERDGPGGHSRTIRARLTAP